MDSLIIAPCTWVRHYTRTRCWVFDICVCLFAILSANACSASLAEYVSPGENYKEIRSLLVLDKICMGEKGKRKESIGKIMLKRGQRAPSTLRIKNIHLYRFCKQEFCKWERFSQLKAAESHFWFICLQSIRLTPSVPGGESFLNCYRIKQSPPCLWLSIW